MYVSIVYVYVCLTYVYELCTHADIFIDLNIDKHTYVCRHYIDICT